jgi:hypothetical protein
MLHRINKLTNWQLAICIALVGFIVFSSGLHGQFQGDDIAQIVNNVPVHSITNVRLLFEGGTFYAGHGLRPLSGYYYRPLMMVVFALLYSLFGLNPFYYHLFQLLLCIASSVLVYYFFKYFFNTLLSFILALIFLLHPIDSQVVYSIPNIQDALCFFFGIAALVLLLRFSSLKSLLLVVACLFLALLSKETGLLFIVMAGAYLFWQARRKRLYQFLGIMTVPVIGWLSLKIQAVGLNVRPAYAQIDNLSIIGRLMTIPSLLPFYISKLLFPWELSSGYYFIHASFSVDYVLVPLIIDCLVIAILGCLAFLVRNKGTKYQFMLYCYFLLWATIGMLTISQIIVLDMTASDAWFYFIMVGVLGMVGVMFHVYQERINPKWFMSVVMTLLIISGVTTYLRGNEWKTPYILAQHNIAADNMDFNAYDEIATIEMTKGDYVQALPYAQRAALLYPDFLGYLDWGDSLMANGYYQQAQTVYSQAIHYSYSNKSAAYENRAVLSLAYGSPQLNQQFFSRATSKYPHDSTIWLYDALFLAQQHDSTNAKFAITKAKTYGHVSPYFYDAIMANHPFQAQLLDQTIAID